MPKLPRLFRWLIWVVLIQFVLLNISAALYAHSFSCFHTGKPSALSNNIFSRTWRLFRGPEMYKSTDEPAPSFSFQDYRLKTRDGLSFSGWLAEADTSKPCILFLHGYTGNRSLMLGEATAFHNWGYPVFLINYRGHGNSSSNCTSMGMKETAEISAAFSFLQSKGHNKVIIYGMSLGAVIAIRSAAREKINPAAIIADMPFLDLHSHLRSRMRLLGFPAEPFGTLVTFWEGVEHGYNGFHNRADEDAQLVNCPVLLQWGDRDSYVERNETEAIYKSLASPRKKLVVYAGLNHESYLLAEPNKWEQEVQAFLKEINP